MGNRSEVNIAVHKFVFADLPQKVTVIDGVGDFSPYTYSQMRNPFSITEQSVRNITAKRVFTAKQLLQVLIENVNCRNIVINEPLPLFLSVNLTDAEAMDIFAKLGILVRERNRVGYITRIFSNSIYTRYRRTLPLLKSLEGLELEFKGVGRIPGVV
jgi:hypothetical protein